MFRLSRRSFVAWLGTVAAAVGLGRRDSAALPPAREGANRDDLQDGGAPLDGPVLRALATAVLPSELESDGAKKAATAFSTWASGYRAGAELLHPYGSAEIRSTGTSPLPTWRAQLAALDQNARRAPGAATVENFASLGVEERRRLVRDALRGLKVGGMPSPLDAPHVALALMAHFYDSPDATDLCYRAQIQRNRCRPLVNSTRRPLPLVRPESGRIGGGGTGGFGGRQ